LLERVRAEECQTRDLNRWLAEEGVQHGTPAIT
jgi:endogenous inhibitor of DNA gyrase (YacG/DUF329 family)